jgi:hypothetical protein
MAVTMTIVFVVLYKLAMSKQSQRFMIIVISFMQMQNVTFLIVLGLFSSNAGDLA